MNAYVPNSIKEMNLIGLQLDGEIIKFDNAVLKVEYDTIDVGDSGKPALETYIFWRIEISNSDLKEIDINSPLMDIECLAVDGKRYGGSGFTSEIESENKKVIFVEVRGRGELLEYNN